nr:hypothetical protein SBE_004198 [Streptomyces sp. SBE_14.2]
MTVATRAVPGADPGGLRRRPGAALGIGLASGGPGPPSGRTT